MTNVSLKLCVCVCVCVLDVIKPLVKLILVVNRKKSHNCRDPHTHTQNQFNIYIYIYIYHWRRKRGGGGQGGHVPPHFFDWGGNSMFVPLHF